MDGDGLVDLIAGNDAGKLLFVNNIGTKQRAEFDNPVPVLVGGKPLDVKAGYRGSIQGPGEAMWGYTCPTLYDWNGDGRLDVDSQQHLWRTTCSLQQIPSDGVPGVQRGPADVLRRTATSSCLAESAGDHRLGGRSALDGSLWTNRICSAVSGGSTIRTVERGELLRLTDGSPITANVDEAAGQTGRAKLVAHDWDADGDVDLLIGTSRGLSFPASKTAWLPSHYGTNARPPCCCCATSGQRPSRIRLCETAGVRREADQTGDSFLLPRARRSRPRRDRPARRRRSRFGPLLPARIAVGDRPRRIGSRRPSPAGGIHC